MLNLRVPLRYAFVVWSVCLVLVSALVVVERRRGAQPGVHAFAIPLGLTDSRLHVTTRTNGRVKLWYHAPAQARIRLVADFILPTWPLITLTTVTATAAGGFVRRGRRETNMRRRANTL